MTNCATLELLQVLRRQFHPASHACVRWADTYEVPVGKSDKVLVLLDRVQDPVAIEEDATSRFMGSHQIIVSGRGDSLLGDYVRLWRRRRRVRRR